MLSETDYRYYFISYSQFMESHAPGDNMPSVHLQHAARSISDGLDLDYSSSKGVKLLMHSALCEAFALALQGSPYVAKDVAIGRGIGAESDTMPDLAIYPDHPTANAAYTYESASSTTVSKDRHPHIASVAWAWMTFPIVIKGTSPSAFHFDNQHPTNLLNESDGGREARTQHASCIAEILLRQHRTHVFSVYICRQHARLLRWDRTGILYTEPLNITGQPHLLLNFIYRVARLSRDDMGYDTSVTLATTQDIDHIRTYRPQHDELKRLATEMLRHESSFPIYKLSVDLTERETKARVEARNERYNTGLETRSQQHLLIGKHCAGHYSPTGRGTRGFIAMEIPEDDFPHEEPRLCFLKDYWRPMLSPITTEFAAYGRLKEAGVKYVPTVVGGGDVINSYNMGQTVTHWQQYIDDAQLEKPLPRQHTRLVMREIGRPMTTYANSWELVWILVQVLHAHEQAWSKAKILHQDISTGNIMIDVLSEKGMPRALLIDWDLCKFVDDVKNEHSHFTGRSGTWPYLSAHLLRYAKKPNELADDLESVVYVFTENVLRFHRHSLSVLTVKDSFRDDDELAKKNRTAGALSRYVYHMFYEETELEDGYVGGGSTKWNQIKHGAPDFLVVGSSSASRLDALVRDLYRLLKEHYSAVPPSSLQQCFVPDKGLAQNEDDEEFEQTLRPDIKLPDEVPAAMIPELRVPVVQEWEVTPHARRLLDSHGPIAALFAQYLYKPGTTTVLLVGGDKTVDQFHGLRQKADAFPRALSKGSQSTDFYDGVAAASRRSSYKQTSGLSGEQH